MEKPKCELPDYRQLADMSEEEIIITGKKYYEESRCAQMLIMSIGQKINRRKDLDKEQKKLLGKQLFEEGKAEIRKNVFG